MAVFILLVIWFAGYIISGRVYYRRRCGTSAAPGKPGLFTAMMPSLIWPVMLFTEGYRNPPLCTHREHVLGRQRAADVEARVQARIREERSRS